ncbi:MAG: hypothetical protein ABJE47_21240 [bacterium]
MSRIAIAAAVVLLACHQAPQPQGGAVRPTATTDEFNATTFIPSVAPESITTAMWIAITQPDNIIPRGPGGVIRDVITVHFETSATAANRQYAMAQVRGSVVGGTGAGVGEHVYYVRIPYHLAAGDSALGPVLRATVVLRALPFVKMAAVVATGPVIVPNAAPRGISQTVIDSAYAPANLLNNPPSVQGIVARNTLLVRFVPTATLAQREAAFALVDADVIGGMLGTATTEGLYYIRLRHAIALPPDSTSGPMLRALKALKALPYVRAALYDRLDQTIDVFNR